MKFQRAFAPPRCPHRRGWLFGDLWRAYGGKEERRCIRYKGHAQFGYKCQDAYGNDFIPLEPGGGLNKPGNFKEK